MSKRKAEAERTMEEFMARKAMYQAHQLKYPDYQTVEVSRDLLHVSVVNHHGDCMTSREPLQKMIDRRPAFALWHTNAQLEKLKAALGCLGPIPCGRKRKTKAQNQETKGVTC